MSDIKSKIEWLFNESGITVYRISQETDISTPTLYKYTTGKSAIGNMSLDNAIKLYEFAKEMENMKTYTIDYNTGIKEVVEATNLDDVKVMAAEGMEYTQQNVTIKDEDGEVLTVSHWWGIEPGEDAYVLTQFGDFGYYQMWDDELENR